MHLFSTFSDWENIKNYKNLSFCSKNGQKTYRKQHLSLKNGPAWGQFCKLFIFSVFDLHYIVDKVVGYIFVVDGFPLAPPTFEIRGLRGM